MKVTSQGQKFIEKMCRVTECSLTVTTCPEEQAQRESIFLWCPHRFQPINTWLSCSGACGEAEHVEKAGTAGLLALCYRGGEGRSVGQDNKEQLLSCPKDLPAFYQVPPSEFLWPPSSLWN